MAELSIAIADDNRQTLNLLGEILEKEDGIHVVGKADNGCDHAETGRNFRHGKSKKQHADEELPVLHHGDGGQQPGCDRGRVPARS